ELAGQEGPCPNCGQAVHAPSATYPSPEGTAQETWEEGALQATPLFPGLGETPSAFSPSAPPVELQFLRPPEQPDELGRLGPFRALKLLGVGGMGLVFEVEDVQLKRRVALKVMKPVLAADPEFRQRFLREAQLAAAIEHEHVVALYQVGADQGVPYLAMQLLRGESLESRLERAEGWLLPGFADVLRIGRATAEGLAAAHARGLVHGDIKPANLWLEAGRDRVKIVDFGLAWGAGEDVRLTQAGALVGTPAYMSPEQANAAPVDHRCDLFSLGSVLYRLATGQLPFPGKDTLSILTALATRDPEPPENFDPSLPPGFCELVMRLLSKDPDRRPQSARDVAETLAAIERGPTSPPISAPARVPAIPTAPQQPSPQTLEPTPGPDEDEVAEDLEIGEEQEAAVEPARPVPRRVGAASERAGKRRKPGRTRATERDKASEPRLAWHYVVLIAAFALLAVALVVAAIT